MLAFCLAALTIFFLLLIGILDLQPATAGFALFVLLALPGLLESILISESANGLFADERRNSSLSLILSTGISPFEVIVGKLAALFIGPLSRLLAILPCLLIVSWMQAGTLRMCMALVLTLFVLLFLNAGLNLFASLLFEERSTATIAALAFLLLLIGFFPILNALDTRFGYGGIDRFWMALNPATAPWLLLQDPGTTRNLAFIYTSITYTALLAFFFFSSSAYLLGQSWRYRISGGRPSLWTQLHTFFSARRKTAARALLEDNPYSWLIHRDFQPSLITWGTFSAIALLWLLGLWRWRSAWLIPMNYWTTLFLLGLFLRSMIQYLGARQIGLDRSNGTLELLLTTPVSAEEILGAQQLAVRNYVRPFFFILASLHLIFFALGLFHRTFPPDALVNYILISALVALFGPWFNFEAHWTAFWISLNVGRSFFAIFPYLRRKSSWWSLLYFLFLTSRIKRLPDAPTGSFGETALVAGTVILLILWFIFYRFLWNKDWNTSQQFRRLSLLHLRSIAAQPIPDLNDSRLPTWDLKTPLLPLENEASDEDPKRRDELSRQRILQQGQ